MTRKAASVCMAKIPDLDCSDSRSGVCALRFAALRSGSSYVQRAYVIHGQRSASLYGSAVGTICECRRERREDGLAGVRDCEFLKSSILRPDKHHLSIY